MFLFSQNKKTGVIPSSLTTYIHSFTHAGGFFRTGVGLYFEFHDCKGVHNRRWQMKCVLFNRYSEIWVPMPIVSAQLQNVVLSTFSDWHLCNIFRRCFLWNEVLSWEKSSYDMHVSTLKCTVVAEPTMSALLYLRRFTVMTVFTSWVNYFFARGDQYMCQGYF